jgi:hypothetical protein
MVLAIVMFKGQYSDESIQQIAEGLEASAASTRTRGRPAGRLAPVRQHH